MKAENDKLQQEVALLREKIRIEDARHRLLYSRKLLTQ